MDGTAESSDTRSRRPFSYVGRLRGAFSDLLSQEFRWSTGHLATVASGCVFAPSLLTFWFVNGLIDFSTAAAIGAIGSPGDLVVRVVAYLLLVPVYLALRAGFYLAHPTHRQTLLSGSCPRSEFLSLDWFSVGILATGLPLALQDLGPWLGMNAVFLVGIFVVPRFFGPGRERASVAVRFAAIALGVGVFVYAKYGDWLVATIPLLPPPGTVLGPVATLSLSAGTTDLLLAVVTSVLTGPPVIAAFGFAMNRVLTRPELRSLPVVRHSLPRRDPARVVVASAALGTVFYLAVVAVWTGRWSLLPA